MSILNKISLLLIIICLGQYSPAQTVAIPDPGFRQFLLDDHPNMMDGSQNLIIDSAATWTDTLWAQHKGIADLTGVEHFINITGLDVLGNNLTYIPDLSTITNLKTLVIDSNNVSSMAPINGYSNLYIFKCDANNLGQLPDLTGLTQLDRIFCRDNNLSALPDLSTLTNLDKLICTYNQLTSLPDFSGSLNFDRLICHHNLISELPDYSLHPTLSAVLGWANQLTFDDILLMTKHPNFSSNYVVKPQDSIVLDTTYTGVEGSEFTINIGIDDTVTTNNYAWYRNNIFITNTNINSLTINNVALSDSGSYHVIITNSNPQLSSHSIVTESFIVKILPCIDLSNAEYEISQINCENGASVNILESSIELNSLVNTYTTFDSTGDSTQFSSNQLNGLSEGSYSLKLMDINGCSRTKSMLITIPHISECDPTFSPNGDGNNDSFYISLIGRTQIFNTAGELINEFQSPRDWDGNTHNGSPAPMGYYAIVVDESTVINITLVR